MTIDLTLPWLRDYITGTSNRDVISTFNGNDTVYGKEGDDLIDGGDDDDTLYGDAGNDTLVGGADDDEIHGGDDNDVITGGRGTDNLFGDSGNDTFIQHDAFGGDFIDGGSFLDTVDYNSTQFSVKYAFGAFGFDATAVMTLEPGPASVTAFVEFGTQWTNTLRSVEKVITGALNDTITGNDDSNTMLTNGGDDVLRGRGGIDDMDGGAGNDVFIYESWNDSMMPPPSDFGLFGAKGDLIRNFGDVAGNQDVIDLSGVDANRQAFARGNENFRADDHDGQIEAGELFIIEKFDPAQNRTVSVATADTDGNGAHDFVIRFDRVLGSLDVSDFIL